MGKNYQSSTPFLWLHRLFIAPHLPLERDLKWSLVLSGSLFIAPHLPLETWLIKPLRLLQTVCNVAAQPSTYFSSPDNPNRLNFFRILFGFSFPICRLLIKMQDFPFCRTILPFPLFVILLICRALLPYFFSERLQSYWKRLPANV